ncbi:MAG: DUF3179 domain-containing protein [Chloroflexi bacterium]|nr:DUF3179 domain-containing protein [Chloroflexota bacterium]
MINGEAVEFGVSGKLYNSNLVMYDRKTDSYWTQLDGLAIIGEMAGTRLKPVNIDTLVWRDWKAENTDAEVLSQETGFFRRYGVDPYGSYYEDSLVFFPVESRDDRVHPKTVVFGVELNKSYQAGERRCRHRDRHQPGDRRENSQGKGLLVCLVRFPSGYRVVYT